MRRAAGALWWPRIVSARIVVAADVQGGRGAAPEAEQLRKRGRGQLALENPGRGSSRAETGADGSRVSTASGWCRVGGAGSEAGLSPAGRDEGREEAEQSRIS